MIQAIRELFQYKELVYMLVWREIRIKYKQSIMGFMWAIFMPIIIILAGILVRLAMATLAGKSLMLSDIASVSVKALPWAFFVASIRFATQSLTANANLVTKIYFPRQIFPICAVLSQLFDFTIASCVLTVVLVVMKVGFSIYLLWTPVLLILAILLATGLGIFFSAANLFFRDVKYLVEVILNFAIFFTPVFYEVKLAGKWGWVLMLNPIAPVLEALNSCIVLHEMPKIDWILYSALFSLVTIWGSTRFFKTLEPRFAESI
jgi:lipopolysaccharide transport system permease protein